MTWKKPIQRLNQGRNQTNDKKRTFFEKRPRNFEIWTRVFDQMNSIFHLATIVSRKSLQKSFQESSPESLNWKIVDKIPVGSFDVD